MLSLGGKSTWFTSVTEFNVCITRLGLVYDSGNDKQMNDGVSKRRWDQFNENHWKMKVKFRWLGTDQNLTCLSSSVI